MSLLEMEAVEAQIETLPGLEELEIHPAADLFPLMGETELAALAEDIKGNGLLQPIVMDEAGRILDGRNRLRACAMAGVTPRFQTLDGDDPLALVIALNIARRNTTASQRAIVAAEAWEKFGRNTHGGKRRGSSGNGRHLKENREQFAERFYIGGNYIQHAAFLLKHSPDAAEAVKRGEELLMPAYEAAREEKNRRDAEVMNLKRLRETHPDLAERVDAGEITLSQAMRDAETRTARDKTHRFAATTNLLQGQVVLDQPATVEHIDLTVTLIDPQVEAQQGRNVNAACLRRVAAFASALAEALEGRSVQ